MDRRALLYRFLGGFVGATLSSGLVFSFAYGISYLNALAKVVWPCMLISLYFAFFPAPKAFYARLIHGVGVGILAALAFKYSAF